MPDSSPEWGAEEESVFFDNPLFLESPCSDTGSSGAHFSWGFPDSLADVRPGAQSPQVLEPPVLGGRVPWELGSKLDLGDSTAGSSGHTTPPFPMPIYKPHLLSAAQVDAPKGPPAVLSGWGEHQVSQPLTSNPGWVWGIQRRAFLLVTPGWAWDTQGKAFL